MPRLRRFDAPGVLHHVMNRGIARRTVFETREEIRYFLSLLAREVRAGRIEILAYSILTTHFHLLVRSRTGELDRVMQRVMNLYVRRFNRTRRRDGPLFRSRYIARHVSSRRYRKMVIRYIDQNAPKARLVYYEAEYPFCSAYHYSQTRRPPWLDTHVVDDAMGHPAPAERAAAYARAFGRPMTEDERELLAQRIRIGGQAEDDWDSLVNVAPPRVLDWMRRKARLADGTKPGLPYVTTSRLLAEVQALESEHGKWLCAGSPKRRSSGWPMLRAGLLRDLGGQTYRQIAAQMGRAPSLAVRRVAQHAALLAADEVYATRASEVASRCLAEQ